MKKKEIKERIGYVCRYTLEGDVYDISRRVLDNVDTKVIAKYLKVDLAVETSWDGCGGYDIEFILYGIREETDKELAKRQEKAKKARLASKKSKAKAKETKEERDKVEYERLKAKFEGGK